MFKKLLFVTALCLQMSSAFAQEKWTLEKCIKYALDNNVQLKITALNIEANQATLMQSQMARLPNLNANIQPSWSTGRQVDPFTNEFVERSIWSTNLSVGSQTTVFNGFQQVNTIKQNQVNLEGSRMDTEKAKNDLVLNVTNAYVQIVLNRELIAVARLQLQNTEEQLARTLKLIEAGRLPEANKYDVISQRANDELRITQAENDLAIAELRLKQMLQLPMTEKFDIEIPIIQEPDENAVLSPPDQIYETAQAMQPDIKSADLAIRSTELDIEIARGNAYPSIVFWMQLSSLYSSLGQRPIKITPVTTARRIGWIGDDPATTDPTKQVFIPQTTDVRMQESPLFYQLSTQNLRKAVGMTIQIPIFNRFQVTGNIAQARIRSSRATFQAVNVRNQLRQIIEQAYVDARAASKSYASNKQKVRALEESAKVTEQKFNFGAANSIDYALAKNNLAIAQSDLVRMKYAYVLRLKVLDFYSGKEIKF